MQSIRVTIRILAAVIAIGAIAFVAQNTLTGVARGLDSAASATQIAQMYAEGCFFLIAAIGVAIALYIGSRWD